MGQNVCRQTILPLLLVLVKVEVSAYGIDVEEGLKFSIKSSRRTLKLHELFKVSRNQSSHSSIIFRWIMEVKIIQ
jgi:hypothetical protein